MYLGTGDMVAIILALVSAMAVIGFAIRLNNRLNIQNMYLRKRNMELMKRMENMVERPF